MMLLKNDHNWHCIFKGNLLQIITVISHWLQLNFQLNGGFKNDSVMGWSSSVNVD